MYCRQMTCLSKQTSCLLRWPRATSRSLCQQRRLSGAWKTQAWATSCSATSMAAPLCLSRDKMQPGLPQVCSFVTAPSISYLDVQLRGHMLGQAVSVRVSVLVRVQPDFSSRSASCHRALMTARLAISSSTFTICVIPQHQITFLHHVTSNSACAGSFVGAGRQENSATPSDFVMAEGKGWKLGYDRSPASSSSYSALIGSEGFSFAITRQEYDDFIKVGACMSSVLQQTWQLTRVGMCHCAVDI